MEKLDIDRLRKQFFCLFCVLPLVGVVAYGVTQRTREIGIRLAVGAQQRDVLKLIIRQGMQPVFVGLAIGLCGAFGLMRLLVSQLYEVRPTDPATFSMVAVGLVFVALAACFIPARRAAPSAISDEATPFSQS